LTSRDGKLGDAEERNVGEARSVRALSFALAELRATLDSCRVIGLVTHE
jgi:hypothetical protein